MDLDVEATSIARRVLDHAGSWDPGARIPGLGNVTARELEKLAGHVLDVTKSMLKLLAEARADLAALEAVAEAARDVSECCDLCSHKRPALDAALDAVRKKGTP